MPDPTKKGVKILMQVDMVNLARIHRYYLQGFHFAIESEYEVRKANEFIELIEKMLLHSGYMTKTEVDARHRVFKDLSATQPAEASAIEKEKMI